MLSSCTGHRTEVSDATSDEAVPHFAVPLVDARRLLSQLTWCGGEEPVFGGTGQHPGYGRRMTGVECQSAAGRPRQAIAAGLLLSVVTLRWSGGVACRGPARCRPSRRAAARRR